MACEGVCEFDLKRLVARVSVGGFVDFTLAPEMRMVGADVVVQCLALGPRLGGALGSQHAQVDVYGKTGVVGHVCQPHLGFRKGGVVPFEARQDAVHDERVPICNQVGRQLFVVCKPMVVVGHDHEAVAGVEVVFLPQNPCPNLLVELHGAFVGPRDDHQVVFAVFGVQVDEQIFQLLPKHPLQPRSRFEMRQRHGVVDVCHGHAHAQVVGVAQNGAVQFLPHHVVQGDLSQGQIEGVPQFGALKGGALRRSYRGKLRVVADEHEPTPMPRVDKLHEVVQQAAVLKASRRKSPAFTNHGSFIDDEQRVRPSVGHQSIGCASFGIAFGTVDVTVDGRGVLSGMARQDFGGPARGGQQHTFLAGVAERANDCTHGGGFARSCIPAEHEGAARLFGHDEPRPHVRKPLLAFRGGERDLTQQAGLKFSRTGEVG